MGTRYGRLLGLGLVVALAGCGQGDVTTAPTSTSPMATSDLDSTTTIRDIMDVPRLAPLEPGTYSIDPDDDPSTPLRVLYTVAADGWSQWIGATKYAGDGFVGVSIAVVTNLVGDGCRDHTPANPPVGGAVDDLATALADLAPFRVTSPPTDVIIYGYSGKHMELTVPDMPVEVRGDGDTYFTGCVGGLLFSWIAPPLNYAFYGYPPRQTEEFWILDVEGSRLVIEANWGPDSPPDDIAEMRAILDSIRIEP